jgi:hypothetical protein
MITLKEILSDLYVDRTTRELDERLKQCGLLEPLKKTIIQLNTVICDQKKLMASMKILPVGHIAANILFLVNRRLADEPDPDTKAELENLCSDVCMRMLKQFFDQLQCPTAPLYQQVVYALQETSTFHQYDFNQLLAFLKLDTHLAYHQSLQHAERFISSRPAPFYYWKGSPRDKQEFLQLLREQKLVTRIKGVAALFGSPNNPLKLGLDPARADILLQLFYTLKKDGWLSSPKGWGFYQVLAYHTPDFEQLFLHHKSPKRRINALKESKQQWADNQTRIDKWLSRLTRPQPGPRTGHARSSRASKKETVSV